LIGAEEVEGGAVVGGSFGGAVGFKVAALVAGGGFHDGGDLERDLEELDGVRVFHGIRRR
jgi:hypothetical protein